MSRQSSRQQVALLKFGDSALVPTVLDRIGPWTSDKGLVFENFRIPLDEKGDDSFHRRYRQFKADLTLTDGELSDNERLKWRMLSLRDLRQDTTRRVGTAAQSERSAPDSTAEMFYKDERKRPYYFSGVQAAEVFLYRICRHAVDRVRDHFPGVRDIKVHFTVPAYEEDEGGKGPAFRYRQHLKQAVQRFSTSPQAGNVFQGVDFRVLAGPKQWLYEPYGVYYYYAAFARTEAFRKPGATYLIVDMGGSTTDFSVVQVNKAGTQFSTYPSCMSVQIGGTDLDRFLLEKFLGGRVPDEPEEVSRLLDRIECAKIEVSERRKPVPLDLRSGKLNKRLQLTPQLLDERVQEFWVKKFDGVSLADALESFIRQVRERAKDSSLFHEFDQVEKVFLAGGSVQLAFVRKLIHRQLVQIGLVTNANEPVMPPREVNPSSVTALGQAVELVPRMQQLQLERAERVFAEIRDDQNRLLDFWLEDVEGDGGAQPLTEAPDQEAPLKRRGETLIYSREITQAFPPDRDGKIKIDKVVGKRLGYRPLAVEETVPSRLSFRFRNDLEENWQPTELEYHADTSKVAPGSAAITLELSTEIHPPNHREHEDSNGARLRVKPHFFWREPNGGDRSRIDLPEQRRTGKTRGSHVVSLRRGMVAGDVHICIDFGMSNTTVAIVAPGRPIPSADDLMPLSVSARAEQDEVLPPGERVGDPPLLQPAPKGSDELPPTNPTVGPPGAMPVNLQQIIEAAARAGAEAVSQIDARWREIEESLRARDGALQNQIAGLQGAQRLLEQQMEGHHNGAPSPGESLHEAVAAPIRELAREVGNLVERRPESSDGQSRFVHPQKSSEDEYFAEGSALQRPRPAGFRRGLGEESLDQLVEEFKAYLRTAHPLLHYPDPVIRAALAQCESSGSRLTILAGPPGTGKSTLVRILAEFYNPDLSQAELRSFFLLQPVSPSWFSSASLVGGYSEIDGRFRGTSFLKQLYRASVHHDMSSDGAPRLFLVCLDEFNLAPPEQYFAEFLSRMEADAASPDRELLVCAKEHVPDLEADISVRISPNLRFFGAINIDASTHQLSAKVLDRAHLIRLTPSQQDLKTVARSLSSHHEVEWFHEKMEQLLDPLYHLGTAARTPIGYRALAKSYQYAAQFAPGAVMDTIDDVLCSFLLTRLPGLLVVHTEAYHQQLEKCQKLFEDRGYSRARELLGAVREGLPGQVA